MAADNLTYRMTMANIVMGDLLGYKAGRSYLTHNPFKLAKRLGRSALGILAAPVVAPFVYAGAALLAGVDAVRESRDNEAFNHPAPGAPVPVAAAPSRSGAPRVAVAAAVPETSRVAPVAMPVSRHVRENIYYEDHRSEDYRPIAALETSRAVPVVTSGTRVARPMLSTAVPAVLMSDIKEPVMPQQQRSREQILAAAHRNSRHTLV